MTFLRKYFCRHRLRVAWCSSYTGAKGHGDPLPAQLAIAWRDFGNQEFPDFRHWVEPV